ncbi:MAG: family 20 glycosylhydrolase [Kiritimatiellae bacterium]|nr:family 20 glycosylhydrolase [Kiritimatiellia bacterium]
MKTLATIFFLLCAAGGRCDAIDELLPVPRRVVRGAKAEPFVEAGKAGAYRISIRDGKASVEANDAEGRRYAKVTLAQLDRLSRGRRLDDCTIDDWPEFKYRGLMLDCGRNWQSVESILDVIDHLARYKMNVFHWHITDNYGWRLESKKHPELQKNEAFSRQTGKFYTQAEFRKVLAHAKKRGVMVIPEMDMPGHTLAFRKATGIDDLASEKAKIVLGELIEELCSLAPADDMPIIHLGTDEARERGEKVPQSHLDYWAKKVTDNGRILMGWSPGLRLPGQTVKHLWMGAKDPRGDSCGYVDSQNSYYINHVDPEELLSVAAYQQPCRWGAKDEKLGAIIGVWHDDAIAETEDVARMNAVYPAITLLSDNFWRGREKDEPSLYARLPSPEDPRFAIAADLERRLVAHRDKLLGKLKHPFPYVPQTMMRWRLSDENGTVLATDVPQATVYPRHFWFPAGAYHPKNEGTTVMETWITSPKDVECGAWIGATGFSRSDGRSRDAPTPKRGEWNKHGAKFELNGEAIDPPEWIHPGVGGNPKEQPLVDEDYWYRAPSKIRLKKGVNHVKVTLPKKGGWKWIGTFVPMTGTSDRPREVKGLRYSSSPL